MAPKNSRSVVKKHKHILVLSTGDYEVTYLRNYIAEQHKDNYCLENSSDTRELDQDNDSPRNGMLKQLVKKIEFKSSNITNGHIVVIMDKDSTRDKHIQDIERYCAKEGIQFVCNVSCFDDWCELYYTISNKKLPNKTTLQQHINKWKAPFQGKHADVIELYNKNKLSVLPREIPQFFSGFPKYFKFL